MSRLPSCLISVCVSRTYLPAVTPGGNCRSAGELVGGKIPPRSELDTAMVKRKTPSPKQKKTIVKHMVKDAKKLRSAYAKGKKKKFQAVFGRLSAAMIDIDSKADN
jgi:hypothetical protein